MIIALSVLLGIGAIVAIVAAASFLTIMFPPEDAWDDEDF